MRYFLAVSLSLLIVSQSSAQPASSTSKTTITKTTVVKTETTTGSDAVTKPGAIQPADEAPFKGKRATVDVAILLDTSNSMDGLIAQAKNQLWSIVQQFAAAKKAGQTPHLRISVFEYGNSNLPAAEGYIRQAVGLTDDLDNVSEVLFALKTQGGDEYCGQVIDEALTRLDWSKMPNSYKAIFIAGNEPFTQGPVDYQKSCRRAIQAGVVVNTIHCGAYEAGVQGQWHHGAQLAEGESFNINQDRAVVNIECPQDKAIIKLNTAFNDTYLWYGTQTKRRGYWQNQRAQDTNAASGLAARGAVKASGAYDNSGRDLVDATKADADILSKIKVADLPIEMQGMSKEERRAHIAAFAKKRAQLQQQIRELNRERQSHLASERKRLAGASEEADATLGDAVIGSVRKQLSETGFDLEN